MFRGESSIAIDAKGRLGIPSRYREKLVERCGGRLVLTIGMFRGFKQHPCLAAYPAPDWEDLEERLGELPSLDSRSEVISTLLVSRAQDCDLDGQGRILLPPSLRDHAGLAKKKRAKFVGRGFKFEVWDEAIWQQRLDGLLSTAEEVLDNPSPEVQSLRF